MKRGQAYKYAVTNAQGHVEERADPYAFHNEVPPATASRAWTLEYEWHDAAWLAARKTVNPREAAMSVYEVHLGSWRRDHNSVLGYRALGEKYAEVFDLVVNQSVTWKPLGPSLTGQAPPISRGGGSSPRPRGRLAGREPGR